MARYTVDSDGNEALVNTNVDGNTIAVHRVVRRLVLRKGNSATCVVKSAYASKSCSTSSIRSDRLGNVGCPRRPPFKSTLWGGVDSLSA